VTQAGLRHERVRVHHANLREFLAALDLAGSTGFGFWEKHFPLQQHFQSNTPRRSIKNRLARPACSRSPFFNVRRPCSRIRNESGRGPKIPALVGAIVLLITSRREQK
jgi:hypothetical protein